MESKYRKLVDVETTDKVSKDDKVFVNIGGKIGQATVDEMVFSTSLKEQITNPFNFKGNVQYVQNLPELGNSVNDTYYVENEKCNYTWNGSAWYKSSLDESQYLVKLNEVSSKCDQFDSRLTETESELSGEISSTKAELEVKIAQATGETRGYVDTKTNELRHDMNVKAAELDDKKITKVYANSDGKTVLTDSDRGKIQDMILYGKSEQKQYSGKNLLNMKNAKGGTDVGVTVAINADGSYSYVGTPTDSNVNVWLLGNYVYDTPILTLAPGKYYVKGVNLYYNSTSIFTGGRNGGFITLTEDTPIAGIRVVSGDVGTSYNETWYPIIAKSDVEVPWEPYVGGIPSPNPDYPQEIKSVVNPVITLSDGENSQTATLPFTLNAIPVSEGGNVTIDGQQYIADYVDVERKKLVRCIGFFNGNVFSYDEATKKRWRYTYDNAKIKTDTSKIYSLCNKYLYSTNNDNNTYRTGSSNYSKSFLIYADADADLSDVVIYTALEVPTEEPLTDEQVNALKALSTYYPTTNVAVTSDELGGYVTFDYPLCFDSAAEYAVGSLQFAFESGLPAANFRIYGSDSKESMYDIRIAVFDSTGVPKQLAQFSMYAYGGKSVGNGTVNTSYGTIRQSGSGYIQLETKEDYNWKVWISGKGWRVEKV